MSCGLTISLGLLHRNSVEYCPKATSALILHATVNCSSAACQSLLQEIQPLHLTKVGGSRQERAVCCWIVALLCKKTLKKSRRRQCTASQYCSRWIRLVVVCLEDLGVQHLPCLHVLLLFVQANTLVSQRLGVALCNSVTSDWGQRGVIKFAELVKHFCLMLLYHVTQIILHHWGTKDCKIL